MILKRRTIMPLKLMYITNNPEVALIVESAGVDWIFVDLEYIGKSNRQGGMNTVQSHHSVNDIAKIRHVLTKSELLVRCNPIHDATSDYCSSKDEIDAIIDGGADIIMLPFFKTVQEVETFVASVNGRSKTMLLVETPEAVEHIDEILNVSGIDFIHIGLNDLSLGYHKKFMFELLTDGTVDYLCNIFKQKGIPYGFGGIASLGKGMIPAEMIIKEHYRLGSTAAILSRSFCNTDEIDDLSQIKFIFDNGLKEIRDFESLCNASNNESFFENQQALKLKIKKLVSQL